MAKLNWSEAYRQQAFSDYEVFEKLNSSGVSYCHILRYMQMCTEKLAKSFISAQSNKERQPNSHKVLVQFIRATHNYEQLYLSMNFTKRNAYSNYLNKVILPVAKALEDYYPSGEYDKPNTEYPWEINNNIALPNDYYFPALDETNSRVAAFWDYIRKCFVFFSSQTY